MIKNPPLLQPGVAVSVYTGHVGTMGPLALTMKGEIVMTLTSHQTGSSKEGTKLLLWPQKIPIGQLLRKSKIRYIEKGRIEKGRHSYDNLNLKQMPYNSSLRIKGINDYLPVVLKKPVEPDIGRVLIKSGWATGVTRNQVLDVSKDIKVQFSDGSVAKFVNQIMTGFMGTHGDSGAFVLTEDSFEPVGLLFAGNPQVTFHNKLTILAKMFNLMGFFCPISLPANTPLSLRFIISSIIPDGFFIQTTNLLNKRPEKIMEQLGIKEITKNSAGGFNVLYEDAMCTNNPHKLGDEGSFLFTRDNKVIGLAVGGNEKMTVAIKIHRVLEALNLKLITNFSRKSLFFIYRSGYWRIRCKRCGATMAPGSICIFCKGKQ